MLAVPCAAAHSAAAHARTSVVLAAKSDTCSDTFCPPRAPTGPPPPGPPTARGAAAPLVGVDAMAGAVVCSGRLGAAAWCERLRSVARTRRSPPQTSRGQLTHISNLTCHSETGQETAQRWTRTTPVVTCTGTDGDEPAGNKIIYKQHLKLNISFAPNSCARSRGCVGSGEGTRAPELALRCPSASRDPGAHTACGEVHRRCV